MPKNVKDLKRHHSEWFTGVTMGPLQGLDSLNEVINPWDDEVIGKTRIINEASLNSTIEAAHRAFRSHSGNSPSLRASALLEWAALIKDHREDLALLITLESGKPISESRGEVDYGLGFIEHFAECAPHGEGEGQENLNPKDQVMVVHEPIGVCAAITPWNFPLAMVTRKVAPALAAGCSVILKPAPETPFTAFALEALAVRAGVAPGLFQVVTGDAEAIGATFCKDSRIRKVSLTGSSPVGRHLYAQCAEKLKRLSLELGGNAPFIVLADADIDLAVEGLMASKFRNAGQTCISPNRIYVHQGAAEAFQKTLLKALEGLRCGSGADPSTTLGPLINDRGRTKVLSHLEAALALGAEDLGPLQGVGTGRLIHPRLLWGVPHDSIFKKEETFGPLIPVTLFGDADDIIAMANDTEAGLAAYLYGGDQQKCLDISRKLEVGMVGINEALISNPRAPFGGIKASGLGREGGWQGLREYQEIKYLRLG